MNTPFQNTDSHTFSIITGAYGSIILDDCNFHESVHLDEFETTRTLHFTPPDGEFSVLNYRISTGDFRLPFKLFPTLGTYYILMICCC